MRARHAQFCGRRHPGGACARVIPQPEGHGPTALDTIRKGGGKILSLSEQQDGDRAVFSRPSLVACWFGALIALTPTTAHASNFSGPNGVTGCFVNVADNRDHSFFYNLIEPATRLAVDWSRANNLNPTDINTLNEVNGVNSTTDVVVFDFDFEGDGCNGDPWISTVGGGGLIGSATCISLSGNACQRFDVRFDTDYMGPRSEGAERALACHEFAHTIGLVHRDGGCVQDPVPTLTNLTTHDVNEPGHVNGYY